MAKRKQTNKLISTHRENIKNLEQESKTAQTLKKLYRLNRQNIKKTNNNLIKLVASPDLILSSYEKIKKNKGASTPGTTKETPDGMEMDRILRISNKLITGTYKWRSIRRKMIPKPGKKTERPLGIVNFDDKLVQECIRMVLNN